MNDKVTLRLEFIYGPLDGAIEPRELYPPPGEMVRVAVPYLRRGRRKPKWQYVYQASTFHDDQNAEPLRVELVQITEYGEDVYD